MTLINFCYYFQFVSVWIHVCAYAFSLFSIFLFFFSFFFLAMVVDFFSVNSAYQWVPYCSRDPQSSLFSAIFSLKIGLMALFTQLNIILLQYFQFSVFSKINCIQTNRLYLYFLLFYRLLFLSYLTYVDNFKKIFIQFL